MDAEREPLTGEGPWDQDDLAGREKTADTTPGAAAPSAPRRPLRSTLAISAALFFLAMGLIVALAAVTTLSQPARLELGPAYALTSLVTQIALVVVGTLNIGAALGILLRFGWARRLGFAMAILGLAVAVIFYVGPLTSFQVPLLDPLMALTIAAVVGYGWCLLALLVSGSHFKREGRSA